MRKQNCNEEHKPASIREQNVAANAQSSPGVAAGSIGSETLLDAACTRLLGAVWEGCRGELTLLFCTLRPRGCGSAWPAVYAARTPSKSCFNFFKVIQNLGGQWHQDKQTGRVKPPVLDLLH